MTTTLDPAATSDRELVLTRLIDATGEKLFQAWTEPGLLAQWFAPLPMPRPSTSSTQTEGIEPRRHAKRP